MNIRDATPGDLARIVEIYNAAIPGRRATADTEPITAMSRAAWFREHDPQCHPLWVAEAAGSAARSGASIAGWLSFQPFYGRPAYRATAELSVYVAPDHQRRGVGRALIGRAIDRAPSLGLKTLLGFIFGHNDPSLTLFEAFGFRRWGELARVAELDGIERDLVIVGLRLDERE
ncbi:MAG TPA: GNAT family N-acetyltransferase [Candidatus Limnocylindrales bacterium]|nr:GNAT family N-acetyltransferase [Candidatus Limnocylindrales bacterium]